MSTGNEHQAKRLPLTLANCLLSIAWWFNAPLTLTFLPA
jgi:hypothetical protein